jgi:hypothetical protein
VLNPDGWCIDFISSGLYILTDEIILGYVSDPFMVIASPAENVPDV